MSSLFSFFSFILKSCILCFLSWDFLLYFYSAVTSQTFLRGTSNGLAVSQQLFLYFINSGSFCQTVKWKLHSLFVKYKSFWVIFSLKQAELSETGYLFDVSSKINFFNKTRTLMTAWMIEISNFYEISKLKFYFYL